MTYPENLYEGIISKGVAFSAIKDIDSVKAINIINIGSAYKDYNGNVVRVLCIAQHFIENETLVIYERLIDHMTMAIPMKMFSDRVDKSKYPNSKQEYMFELIPNN